MSPMPSVMLNIAFGKEIGKLTAAPAGVNTLVPHCIISPPGSVTYPEVPNDCAPAGCEWSAREKLVDDPAAPVGVGSDGVFELAKVNCG